LPRRQEIVTSFDGAGRQHRARGVAVLGSLLAAGSCLVAHRDPRQFGLGRAASVASAAL
jgi:hypothetical protein